MNKDDRVKIIFWECDLCGVICAVSTDINGKKNYLVEADDGFTSWFDDTQIEPTDIIPLENDKKFGIIIGGSGIVKYDGWVVSPNKDKYTKEDLPKMIAEANEMELKGANGYCFLTLKKCIEALKGEYKPIPKGLGRWVK